MNEGRRKRNGYSGDHRGETESRLVLGGFAIVLLTGSPLIALLFGVGPATLAVAFILLAIGLLLALYAGLTLVEGWLKRG